MPLIIERLKRFFRRVSDAYIKNTNKKQLSVVAAASILAIVSSPISDTFHKIDVPQPLVAQETSNVKFDASSAQPVLINADLPKIVPGESQAQAELRVKAEQAQREAEAKRIALAAKSRETVSRERRVYTDPSDFSAIYEAAGAQFGVDPRLLRAIHKVESGSAGSTYLRNPSGATGPMQFLPSTFNRHAVDGNGDGIKDIGNVYDAIFTSAEYLTACGYPDLYRALWGYNPSYSYYNRVMSYVN